MKKANGGFSFGDIAIQIAFTQVPSMCPITFVEEDPGFPFAGHAFALHWPYNMLKTSPWERATGMHARPVSYTHLTLPTNREV